MDTFCLDTSVFIESWRRHYAIDVFQSFWDTIESWGSDGRIIAPDEVLNEIRDMEDDLHKWVKARNGIFIPPDLDVQAKLAAIVQKEPKLATARRGGTGADPWVVALASVKNATVVTMEQRGGGPRKIPSICDQWGVHCISTLDLIRAMGLKF